MKEKFKTILKSNYFFSLLNQGLGATISFLIFLVLARILTLQEFGQWTVYIAFFSLDDMFRAGVLHTPLIHFGTGDNNKQYSAASWIIGSILTFGICLLVIFINFSFPNFFKEFNCSEFGYYFPFLYLFSFPLNLSILHLQIELKFRSILFYRTFQLISFFIATLWCYFNNIDLSLQLIITLHLGSFLAPSVMSTILNANKIYWITHYSKDYAIKFLQYGKFSFATLIGSHLLKSVDIFVISYFLGAPTVALYAVPLRVIDIMEIPIKAIAATAMPKLSRCFHQNDLKKATKLIKQYIGMLTVSLIPIIVLIIAFSTDILTLLGGNEYASSKNVLLIFKNLFRLRKQCK